MDGLEEGCYYEVIVRMKGLKRKGYLGRERGQKDRVESDDCKR